MEQLNVLGCELIMGYNTSQGIHLPDIGRWRATQNMLEVVPKYEKTGAFHFQSIATWIQTLRRFREAADGDLIEHEVDPQVARQRINATLAFDKPHEDPFMHIDPAPSEELQERLNHLLRQDRARVGLVMNFLEQLAQRPVQFRIRSAQFFVSVPGIPFKNQRSHATALRWVCIPSPGSGFPSTWRSGA